MPESYIITGGHGLLGSQVVQQLLSRGESAVAVFDIVSAPKQDERVRVFLGDITHESQFSFAVQECRATCIIHCAALIQGVTHDAMFRVNVDGTKRVIAAARQHRVTKLVYTSSASVVFEGENQAGVNETKPYPKVPFDDYNASKEMAERLILAANEADEAGLKTVALRVAGLFGPGDRTVTAAFMDMLQAGRTRVQIGNNTNLYDFTYIPNAAHAHLLAADRLDPSHPKYVRVAGQVFFITNGAPMPFWDFPRALWREAGHVPNSVIVIPRSVAVFFAILMELWAWLTGSTPTLSRFRVAYVTMERWFDITRARDVLDYAPIASIEEGVRRTAQAWTEAQGTHRKDL